MIKDARNHANAVNISGWQKSEILIMNFIMPATRTNRLEGGRMVRRVQGSLPNGVH
jgi:hypothetical protein